MCVCVCLWCVCFPGRPPQSLGCAGVGYCTLLHVCKKKKKLFSRNSKKKPLQAELITSASPKYVNFIGKKSISYLLKPTLTRLLEQHH